MVCKYVETCIKCRGKLKWYCTAAIPKKRVMDQTFCMDPVESECALYKRAEASDEK